MFRVALIGAGNMAKEIGKRLIRYGGYPAEQIVATHYDPVKASVFQTNTGIQTVLDNAYAVRNSHVIVLCVRPQQVKGVVNQIASVFPREKGVLVNLAVGQWLSWLSAHLQTTNVVHFHPTSLLMVTERWSPAASLWVAHPLMDERLEEETRQVFQKSIGEIWQIPRESDLPPMIYLVGNSPAHILRIVQSFVQSTEERLGNKNIDVMQMYRQILSSLYFGLAVERKQPNEVIDRIATQQGVTRAGLVLLDECIDSLTRSLIDTSIQRLKEIEASVMGEETNVP